MKPIAPIIIKKKKVHGHGGHHGGSWKVAYADFVTAMMAFFMVLWIMGLSDTMRFQIQGYFNDPMGFMKNPPRSRQVFTVKSASPNVPGNKEGRGYTVSGGDVENAKKLNSEIKRKLEKIKSGPVKKLLKNVEITVTPEGLLIEFVESDQIAFFNLGSAKVRPEAREIFIEVGKLLAVNKPPMMINGYTDARPYQSKEFDNWDLSGDRALSLKRVLVQAGVDTNQIECIKAMGPTHFKKPKDPFHSSNRRVTILLPFTAEKMNLNFNLPKSTLKEDISAKVTNSISPSPFPVTEKENKIEGYILGAPIQKK